MVKGKKRSSRQRCVWRETKTNRVYLYLFRYLGPTLSGDFFFFFNIRIFLSPSFRSFLFLFFYSRSLLCFSYFSLFSFLSLFFFFFRFAYFCTTEDLSHFVVCFHCRIIDRSKRIPVQVHRWFSRGGKKEGRARIPGVGGVEPREGIPLSPRFPEDPPRAE